jgi:hypothetical protein
LHFTISSVLPLHFFTIISLKNKEMPYPFLLLPPLVSFASLLPCVCWRNVGGIRALNASHTLKMYVSFLPVDAGWLFMFSLFNRLIFCFFLSFTFFFFFLLLIVLEIVDLTHPLQLG